MKRRVERRSEAFALRTVTRIWEEQASEENPYLADSCRCYGYDLLDLMEKRTLVEVLFLLLRGELPSAQEARLLESLMIALINPGPRHPATRAAMIAGVGKTDPAHILPISLGILGGSHLGADSIEGAIRFLRKHMKSDPGSVACQVMETNQRPKEGDWHPVPGFGSRFGSIDSYSREIADRLLSLVDSAKALSWGNAFADELRIYQLGWLPTGIAAAVFSDLGFHPRAGAGLFQLISAPGLLAHGLEQANKPLTSLPFPSDEEYILEK